MTEPTSAARKIPASRTVCILVSLMVASPAAALSLVDTAAGVLDTNHYQVQTVGGSQAHLLRIVTSLTVIDAAMDADVLLADGEPLVMTWRRDAGDADLIDFSVALAFDHGPCHLEVAVRGDEAWVPCFDPVGGVSSNGVPAGTPVMLGASRVVVFFDEPIGALEDIHLGDVPTGVPLLLRSEATWRIDIASVAEGELFHILIKAGLPADFNGDGDVDLTDYRFFEACFSNPSGSPPADYDNDGDVDLADFAEWESCLRGPSAGIPGRCAEMDLDANSTVDLADFAVLQRSFTGVVPFGCATADFDASDTLDLRDFAWFQTWFSGADTPVACGGGP